jgi:NAD(P)-dependent dehydrogenase (short-subunit alcohol dehydrogenase family)
MNRAQITRGAWTAADIPDQSGRVAVITGASAGLGLETAKALAGRGATVLLGCRDEAKAERAADLIATEAGAARERVWIVRLDLASLRSVRTAAAEIRAAVARLDLLVNNGGVMHVPERRTEDGFELTFATNHLGHFALTGLLLEPLLSTAGSRVVTVSSLAHRRGIGEFDGGGQRAYDPGRAYADSKLANLQFTFELHERLRAAGAQASALAAHPGNAQTELWRTSSRLERALIGSRLRPLTFWLAQSAREGALGTLRAAVDPAAHGGDYYGPSGPFEYTGPPSLVGASPRARDPAARRRLWDLSERLTRVAYRLPPSPSGLA